MRASRRTLFTITKGDVSFNASSPSHHYHQTPQRSVGLVISGGQAEVHLCVTPRRRAPPHDNQAGLGAAQGGRSCLLHSCVTREGLKDTSFLNDSGKHFFADIVYFF